MEHAFPIRLVLAKVGLDGHDRGVKVVARSLRDAGFHVIYTGLWQSPEAVVRAAADEDADWLGLSILSGAHMTQVPRVLDELRQRGRSDVGLIVGGIIPADDVPRLLDLGVARVFGPGEPIQETVAYLRSQRPARMADDLVERFQSGDRFALARLITLVSRGETCDRVRDLLAGEFGRGRIVAFTGSGGVGKSTLIGALIGMLRKRGKTVAVLACDPESPLTGGALLGDRVRMQSEADDGVFIRSLSAVSGHQSLAENLAPLAHLTRAFGFDVVLLETAGAGQGDIAVREVADTVAVCVQPEAGDELQWEKAGILEVADVVVVHKADLPGAERVEAQLRELLNLPGCRAIPVVRVSAQKNEGLEGLWQAIESTCEP